MMVAEDVMDYARSIGVGIDIRFVFEKGDPEDGLRKLFDQESMPAPEFTWATEHTDYKGFKHSPFVGLQAAGWIAYEYYLDADRVIYGEPSSRRALSEFEKLPGRLALRGQPGNNQDLKVIADGFDKKVLTLMSTIATLDKAKKEGLSLDSFKPYSKQ